MPFSLSERVLLGLLAVETHELGVLLRTLDRIAADPVAACDAAAFDSRGRLVYGASAGRFWLFYSMNRAGRVHFTELLARR